ncbi:MAG: radical SAM protein [Myxococcota bacterium]
MSSASVAADVGTPLLRVVDEDFRRATVRVQARPTRFYLNLTETCQLRCSHCITRAPVMTEQGTARSMTSEVLEALRPHLRHATYVGFTHAGEPMLSPVFIPVLDLLRAERNGQPTVIHLLSNGQAMTETRFAEAVQRGVNSLSFSVDGMSARTHDLLRIGSHIERLLPRIAALAALRRREGWDVRMGIAWTISRDNITELPELIRFVAESGLDWVKLEEMYPINGCAEGLLVDERVLAEAVANAEREAEARGVRLLDHTRDMQVWKCRLHDDERMARFSRMDDFVNRMEINSCRLPYELCCVEPDGMVKPMSFHHPPAGNVLQQDLMAIWNSPMFFMARQESVRARLCLMQGPTCSPDVGPTGW